MSLTATAAPHPDDTIVALSSAPGAGARAIVRVSGPKTRGVVARVFAEEPLPNPSLQTGEASEPTDAPATRAPLLLSPSLLKGGVGEGFFAPRRLVRGSLRLTGVHSPLPATLYFFAGPRSYTGQDLAELHTVGSPPLVERLVSDLFAAGARPARPGEFTMRAFLAGKKDLPQAEAVQAVIDAGTDTDLSAALEQLAGGISRPLDALRDDLLNLLADVEAALDFADEDIEFVTQTATLTRLQDAIQHLEAVQKQLDDRAVSGRPVRIALVGLPNTGKSSLFNALAGGAAIVSPVPGTTRDYLVKPVTFAGVAAELIDTAGWQATSDSIEQQAQQLGTEQTTRADVIVWCDESGAFSTEDESRLRATAAEVLKLRTKADLMGAIFPVTAGVPPAVSRRELPENDPQRDTAREAASGTPAVTGSTQLRCSVLVPGGLDAIRAALDDVVAQLTRPPLAPSQSRCRGHVLACLDRLREARAFAQGGDHLELLALALRGAVEPLGEMTGAIYTNDLLDRIFSRFCIGK